MKAWMKPLLEVIAQVDPNVNITGTMQPAEVSEEDGVSMLQWMERNVDTFIVEDDLFHDSYFIHAVNDFDRGIQMAFDDEENVCILYFYDETEIS